jgi:iron(III) transport system permease protein
MYASAFSEHYLWVLKDKIQQDIFIRSIQLGSGTALLSLLLGVITAILLEYSNLPLRNYLKIFMIIPLLIPPYIIGISWLTFLGKAGDFAERQEAYTYGGDFMFRKDRIIFGTKNQSSPPFVFPQDSQTPQEVIMMLEEQQRPFYLPFDIDIYNVEFAIILLSLSFFPLVFLITSSALRNIDSNLEDAARLLYSPRAVLRKVTLPLISPHIMVSGLFVFIFSITEMGVPSILRVHTLSMEIFWHFSAFFDAKQALAQSFPLVIVILFMILLIHFSLGKRSFITISSSSKNVPLIRLTKMQKFFALFFIFSIVALSSGIPLFVLMVQSKFLFFEAFQKAEGSFFNTLFLGILCATLMMILSFLIAYFFQGRNMDPIILFPLVAPSAAVGIGLIVIWNTPLMGAIYSSFLILVIGYLTRFLPFTIKTFSPFFEQIHPSIEESARLSGASFLKILHKIVLPLMKPGIITSWLIGFILCLRELAVSVLVTPPGFQTLPNRIFTLYHFGDIETVAALSLILIAMILTPVFLFLLMRNHITKLREGAK